MKLKETQNPNPYPHKFHVSRSMTSYIAEYGAEGVIANGDKLEGKEERIVGCIFSIRASSSKVRF